MKFREKLMGMFKRPNEKPPEKQDVPIKEPDNRKCTIYAMADERRNMYTICVNVFKEDGFLAYGCGWECSSKEQLRMAYERKLKEYGDRVIKAEFLEEGKSSWDIEFDEHVEWKAETDYTPYYEE